MSKMSARGRKEGKRIAILIDYIVLERKMNLDGMAINVSK
jgi:hypothetical protein